MAKTYSQNKQDLFVVEYYKEMRGGFFLDVGGCFGIFDNNTYLLEKDYGWGGIIIEAQPRYYEEIREVRPNSVLVEKAIWKEEGEVDFCVNEPTPGLSGILQTNRVKTPKIIKVKTITFEKLLKDYGCPPHIDYCSLDIEGAEFEVLQTFPFDKYTVGIWTIEHGMEKEKDRKITELLISKGYYLIRYNAQDFYWGKSPNPPISQEKNNSGQ